MARRRGRGAHERRHRRGRGARDGDARGRVRRRRVRPRGVSRRGRRGPRWPHHRRTAALSLGEPGVAPELHGGGPDGLAPGAPAAHRRRGPADARDDDRTRRLDDRRARPRTDRCVVRLRRPPRPARRVPVSPRGASLGAGGPAARPREHDGAGHGRHAGAGVVRLAPLLAAPGPARRLDRRAARRRARCGSTGAGSRRGGPASSRPAPGRFATTNSTICSPSRAAGPRRCRAGAGISGSPSTTAIRSSRCSRRPGGASAASSR